jgi:hypothetical protein
VKFSSEAVLDVGRIREKREEARDKKNKGYLTFKSMLITSSSSFFKKYTI